MSEFPVQWADPADAERSWRLDRIHHPTPVAPLDHWMFGEIVARGIEYASATYGRPMRFSTALINTYMYISPEPSASDADPEGPAKLAERTLDVQRFWERELYPEVQSNLDWWSSFDLASLSLDALMSHLAETVERAQRVWRIHFLITNPTFQAVVDFADLYVELCGGTDLDAFRCIQGFGNKTVDAGRGLWGLARAASERPDVPRALSETTSELAIAALETTEAGRAWLSELRDFLDVYGRRSDTFGFERPSWIEDPSSPLDTIRRFILQSEDPYANLERLAEERESAVAVARERLAGDALARFDQLLSAAQAAIVITEDHGFYIDFATTYAVRRVFIEVGRRLVDAGALDRADDIIMLTYDEILDPAGTDKRDLVRQRREEMQRWSAVHPPEFIGAPPMTPPDDDPRSRFVRRFYGPANAGLDDGVLRGAAGAPGRAKGTARLVLDLASADKLEPGDVLVTRTTSPAWTPLFAVAVAVVTDGGGALSHCAIVAREYGLPAVVGTIVGTQTIVDGQTVEVDGNEGVVRVVS